MRSDRMRPAEPKVLLCRENGLSAAGAKLEDASLPTSARRRSAHARISMCSTSSLTGRVPRSSWPGWSRTSPQSGGWRDRGSRPPCRALDGLPVVSASARRPVLASDRRKAEFAFDRQSHNRLSRQIGQRSLARHTVLRRRERARLGVEPLHDQDAGPCPVRTQAVQS